MEEKRKQWTEMEVNFLINNYSDMFNDELSTQLNRTQQSIYLKANKLGLKKSNLHISKCISKRNKMVGRDLNIELLTNIAKKYKSKSEFQKEDPSAYSSARRLKILDNICTHMITKSFSIPQLILKDILSKLYKTENILYNDRKILKPYEIDVYLPDYKLGFEYNGKGWHIQNKNDENKIKLSKEKNIIIISIIENNRNYEVDIKNQLIQNIDSLKIKVTVSEITDIVINNPYQQIYDVNDLYDIAKKYESFKTFYKNEYPVYLRILKLGLIDEFTKHMCCRRKKREIGEVIQVINKYHYLIDLITNDKGTYLYIKKNKLDYLLENLKRLR